MKRLLALACIPVILLALACVAPGQIGGDDDGSGGGGDDVVGPGPDSGAGAGDSDGGPGPTPGSDLGGDLDPLAERDGLVVYWGQNGYGATAPGDPSRWERPLDQVCADATVDMVVLAFTTSFISARNGGLPELNFAFHCETPIDAEHPYLLRCPEIEAGIAACHAAGKPVLLSLGGAAGAYGFTDDAQAVAFADTVWEMFLGGAHDLRPFGAVSLDGVDLDIEGGSSVGYAAFVTRLRERMDASGRNYLIAAAPQCPFPDAYLGPAPGRALGEVASKFDYLFVQFYNNYCSAASGAAFQDTFAQWASLAAAGGPRIVVGLPAAPAAAPAGGYLPPDQLAAALATARAHPAFAGVMLWDASFDQNSGAPGATYGARVQAVLAAP